MSFNDGFYPLFTAQAADGDSSVAEWPGGKGSFTAQGAFGSGTVKLQFSVDGGSVWMDVDRSGDTYVTLAAAGGGLFELPACKLRANLAGSTAASLSAKVSQVP